MNYKLNQSQLQAMEEKGLNMDDVKRVENYKDFYIQDSIAFLKLLDQKQAILKQRYQQCFASKCLQLQEKIKKEESFVFVPESKSSSLEWKDKESLLIPSESQSTIDEYNTCVEECQKDIRDLRYELEFQAREFQLNLNECMHYCKREQSNAVGCSLKCFDMHTIIWDKVKKKVLSQYDLRLAKEQ